MKDREIQRYNERLVKICDIESKHDQTQRLVELAKEIKCYVLTSSGADAHLIYCNIQSWLQTETMINTLKRARTSCFWAAMAALLALLSILVSQWDNITQNLHFISGK